MMTVKQASERWNVSMATVRSYCRKEYIRGVTKAKGQWQIPSHARLPYISMKKKFSGQWEKNEFVLCALESRRYLDFRLLPLTRREFSKCAEMLMQKGYAAKKKGRGFVITQEGCERVEALREKRRIWRREVGSEAFAAAQALISWGLMMIPH